MKFKKILCSFVLFYLCFIYVFVLILIVSFYTVNIEKERWNILHLFLIIISLFRWMVDYNKYAPIFSVLTQCHLLMMMLMIGILLIDHSRNMIIKLYYLMVAYTYANNWLTLCSPNSQILQWKELDLYTYQLALYLLTVHVRICTYSLYMWRLFECYQGNEDLQVRRHGFYFPPLLYYILWTRGWDSTFHMEDLVGLYETSVVTIALTLFPISTLFQPFKKRGRRRSLYRRLGAVVMPI